ncbi:unnamed protein product [Phytophthora lilii]|uniref:Unnamed protein product n=1 Tax=Phytophthora lilii TaxID=2077276 RepID=A0A9W6U473_9STRA|nr:unnamed protein product [Phytophthora lilii]
MSSSEAMETVQAAEAAAAPAATSTGSQRKFGPKWEIKYAVAVTERDPLTQLPTKAVCLMCQAFEREETVGSKRKKSSRVRSFSSPWRPDNMKRHMEQQHPSRWEQYQTLGDGEKRAYFSSARATREGLAMAAAGDVAPAAVAPMVSEPTPSTEAQAIAAQTRAFLIDRDVVDELVADVLFQTTNDDYRNAWNVPVTFTLLEEASPGAGDGLVDLNESRYVARVESLLRFNMCLKYVAMGISFGQVVPLLKRTAEETGTSLNGSIFTEQQLACLCRVACAVNLQTLKNALQGVWAFAIAIERGKNAGSAYLDARVRFERDSHLHDFHLVSVPIREDSPQIIEHQCDAMIKCLDVVAPRWKTQLIGVSTSDCVSKMPSCARVLVNRLSRDCITSFYCEWGAVQQLELVIQKAFDELCNQRFISALTVLAGHFRRQRALIREMNGDVCPKFEEGQWRSISNVLKWFTENRARLTKFIQEIQPVSAPGKEWWITVLAVNSVMERVNVALSSLRGPVATEGLLRREFLNKLVTDLGLMTGALGPLSATQRAGVNQTDNFEVGDFTLSRDATLSFLKEQGSFAINAVDELAESFPTCCQAAVESTAKFVLSIMAKTHRIILDSAEISASSSTVPPFLPQALCKMRNQAFVAHIQFQRVRLLQHFSLDEIEQIEDQHRLLRTAYQLDDHVSQQLSALPAATSFREAWKDGRFGGNDCRLLRQFCGAIASIAADPVVLSKTSEYEFSLINWRRSPFGLSLVDFSLEAVLHAQQYCALSRLREC